MGVTVRKGTKPGKRGEFSKSIFISKCSVVVSCCFMLQSFMLVETFSFLQEFEISFELRFKTISQKKIPKIQKINHSDCYKNWLLAQFGIFSDICGSRQSQISLLTYLLSSVYKLQKQK